jgi:glutamyl-tRNA synthetase
MEDRIGIAIEKYALQNAVRYGSADVEAVAKKIFAIFPGLKPKEIIERIKRKIEEVNRLTPGEARKKLEEIAPELLEREKKIPKKELPDLGADKVVMRFAPNPNGASTLAAARGIILNAEYAKKYRSKFILRFDDTDPVTKKPLREAYEWWIEDCRWLGAPPDVVVYASERIDKYYRFAEELILKDAAYVCSCPKEWFKSYKDAGQPCKHRQFSPEENFRRWKDMLDGKYESGEVALRIKTDMKHPNPAIRDWVAFRIIKAAHPRVGNRYVVWPTLDFESCIEDRLLEVTHIIRGKDLADSEHRQRYIYDYFGWKYPKTLHWGKMKIHEFGKLSTSILRKEIDEGKYDGWDDPRLPTLKALRKRGILPEAIKEFLLSLGLDENDISLSMENLYAINRKMVDPIANRYFWVWDPVLMEVSGSGKRKVAVPLHPNKLECRTLEVNSELWVCRKDFEFLGEGDKVRLKNLYNVEVVEKEPLKVRFISEEVEKGIPIIHWVPPQKIDVEVIKPDGRISGFGEEGIKNEDGKVVQFERFGFVRIDSSGDRVIAYFAHP